MECRKMSNKNVPELNYLETTPTDQSCRYEEIKIKLNSKNTHFFGSNP
jgi:hypothetical protein